MSVPPRPVAPFLPNEAPNLEAAAQDVLRSIHSVDEAIAVISGDVSSLDWRGPDGESFRRNAFAERQRLNGLRVRLLELNRALHRAAAIEAARYRQQAGV